MRRKTAIESRRRDYPAFRIRGAKHLANDGYRLIHTDGNLDRSAINPSGLRNGKLESSGREHSAEYAQNHLQAAPVEQRRLGLAGAEIRLSMWRPTPSRQPFFTCRKPSEQVYRDWRGQNSGLEPLISKQFRKSWGPPRIFLVRSGVFSDQKEQEILPVAVDLHHRRQVRHIDRLLEPTRLSETPTRCWLGPAIFPWPRPIRSRETVSSERSRPWPIPGSASWLRHTAASRALHFARHRVSWNGFGTPWLTTSRPWIAPSATTPLLRSALLEGDWRPAPSAPRTSKPAGKH